MALCRTFVSMTMISLLCASTASGQVLTNDIDDLENQTVVAGLLGSSFGSDADDESVAVGGSLSWLWSSVVGAEFLAGFSPNFTLAGGLNDLQVNNYMFNGIAAFPTGPDRRWQPFISGGIGALTLSTGSEIEEELGIESVDETELGGNIGIGVMRFADRWGFRGDVRYFSQLGDPAPIPETAFLDDVSFWRANIGIAYRW